MSEGLRDLRRLTETLVQRDRQIVVLQDVLAAAWEGISKLDNEGRYVEVNDAYAATLGARPEVLIGQPWSITVDDADLDRVQACYEDMRRYGKATCNNVLGVRADGTTFRKSILLVRDQRNGDHGYFCLMHEED